MSSTILAKVKRRGQPKWWLILDCGHWYAWGNAKAPAGDEFRCPECASLPMATPSDGGQ